MKGRGTLLALAGALALGLLAAWVIRHLEPYTQERREEESREARVNSMLAAQRSLAALGVPVSGVARLERRLPPLGSTIVLGARAVAGHVARSEELATWVRRGGHLILADAPLLTGGKPGLLLRRLDLTARVVETPRPPDRATATAVLGDFAEDLAVDFLPDYQIGGASPDAEVLASSGKQVHAIRESVGNGTLTLLSDDAFLHNHSLGRRDHAAFLWGLVHDHGPVLLVYGRGGDTLSDWLADHAWQALAALALLLAAGVWRGWSRFGPLEPAPDLARRSLAEHVRASGHFLFRHGEAAALVGAVRDAMLRSVTHRHPGWAGAPDLPRRLAEAAGLPEAEVLHALEADGTAGRPQFTRVIHTLETLRRKL